MPILIPASRTVAQPRTSGPKPAATIPPHPQTHTHATLPFLPFLPFFSPSNSNPIRVRASFHLDPVTGKPLASSSSAMTFHRPTSACRSMGVTRRLRTVTLGLSARRACSCGVWASRLGFSFALSAVCRPASVVAGETRASRGRTPESWVRRLRIWGAC